MRGACESWGSILFILRMKESCWRSALLKMPSGYWLRCNDIHWVRGASIIGKVTSENSGLLTMRTALGAIRIVDMLANDPLPSNLLKLCMRLGLPTRLLKPVS